MTKEVSIDVWQDFSAGPGRLHESYEGRECLLRELSIFGWLRFHKAFDQALEPARHEGEYEIHYIVNGELNWWVEDNSYRLTPGMVLIIRPGELHGSQTGVLEPCEHYWLRIRLTDKMTLPGLTQKDSRKLVDAFEMIANRAFFASDLVNSFFEKILYEHRNHSEFSRMASRSALHLLLATLIRDNLALAGSIEYRESPVATKKINRCIQAIDQQLEQPPSIKELAKIAGLSDSAFRKRFREETGSSPHSYVTLRRIQEAQRRLLNSDLSIIDIAMDLGFSSSQYFATVFKRKTGVSPQHYRGRYSV